MEIFEHVKMAAAWWAHYFVCLVGFLVRPTEEDVRRALSLVEFRHLGEIQKRCAQTLGVRQWRVSRLLLIERLYYLVRSGEVEVVEVIVIAGNYMWVDYVYKLTGNHQFPDGRRARPLLRTGGPVPQLAPSSAYAPRSFFIAWLLPASSAGRAVLV
ncbi:MAG: hypothetical protein KBD66_03985 [Candidatus Doudnabacteria bacterium]|nr:hypothetical protein [Candidatus Doudnabacteria bacterium]